MSWHKVTSFKPDLTKKLIELPSSKSISNRLLILQWLANEKVEIENLSKANDTILLKNILRRDALAQDIYCQDAGTVLRFLICLCASQPGRTFYLRGTKRLLERPLQPLLDCLNALGAQAYLTQDQEGKTYISVTGARLVSAPLKISGNISSQFISGLCLIAPCVKGGVELTIEPPIYSRPYIDITLDLMKQLGIKSTFIQNQISIPVSRIQAKKIRVEPDWSSASFFYALLIISEAITSISINGLHELDIQGDRYIVNLCQQFGIRTDFEPFGVQITKTDAIVVHSKEIDLRDYPDLSIPILVACAFRYPSLRFKGLDHLKLKESNRIAALKENLEKFGILLVEESGQISFVKERKISIQEPVQINTHQDHRIAMSFALVAALGYSIELDNIACIHKSFPDFFEEITKLGIGLKK